MSIYFPVLRWKLGERDALTNLSPDVKNQIIPIIEFPLDCDCNDNKVKNFCANAANDWGVNRPFYLDLSSVNFNGAPDGITASDLLRTARQQGLVSIPVLYVNMDANLFNTIQQTYASGYFENMAIRVNEDEEDTAYSDALGMISTLGIEISNIDLIIDLRDISNGHIQAKIRILRDLVKQFGNGYRRRIVLSGAIPSQLDIETDHTEHIPRYDWQLWRQIQRTRDLSSLFFGDYTTVPSEFVEIPFSGAPKIKYTLEDEWYVIKGHRSRGRDAQRQEQARAIANSTFFRGREYSYGDLRIRQCADGEWGPGNATNWVTNDISQHITFVVSQVSAIRPAP